jgi:Fic family protein
VDIDALIAEVDALPPRAAIARETARRRRDEIDGSLAIAGTPLGRAEVIALTDRGMALGVHPYAAYTVAHDLATASRWVWAQRPYAAGDRRPLITIEEIRRLHTLATAGQPEAYPGTWRIAIVPPHGDVVAPPPWLVPFQAGAFVERFRVRPAAGTLAGWIADLLARFDRLRPFARGNGRVGRLVATLVLRRLDAPPLAFAREHRDAYVRALLAAEGREPDALAALVATTLAASALRLIAAGGDDPLLPIRTLAGPDYAALIKASRRGRLRSVLLGGRVLTTAGWIAAYRSG